MNTSRIIILGVAALAAGGAALLARGLLGGGTEKVKAAPTSPPVAMSEILVAANDLQPGSSLSTSSVRWQSWPRSSVGPTFITKNMDPSIDHIVADAVVRSNVATGQPVTSAVLVHADSGGFMAAMVTPGMRAVSIAVSAETGAGGFILPDDRVDVVATIQVSDQPKRYAARILLNDVRVLAIDQTYQENKDQKVVVGKTATLELSPHQAEVVERAGASGQLSLALRSLGDNTVANRQGQGGQPGQLGQSDQSENSGVIDVIRYGLSRSTSTSKE